MGLKTSPAGVPWNYGIENLMQEETRIYSDRLTDEWMRDGQRTSVLRAHGLSDDQLRGAMKIAATGIWGFGCDQVQGNSQRQGWTIRQVAKMNQRGYEWARRYPFSDWKALVDDVIAPMFDEVKSRRE